MEDNYSVVQRQRSSNFTLTVGSSTRPFYRFKSKFGTRCLFDFLTSSLTTRLYRGRVPRLTSDNCTCCHTRDCGETMTSVSAGHIILTPTQQVGSGRSQRGFYPGPPHLELRALLSELPPPPPPPLGTRNKHKRAVNEYDLFPLVLHGLHDSQGVLIG